MFEIATLSHFEFGLQSDNIALWAKFVKFFPYEKFIGITWFFMELLLGYISNVS